MGEALQIQGDWDGALRSFQQAANDAAQLPPGFAWRMALIHQLRGRLTEAFEVYGRAAGEDGSSRDAALLLAWASAYWLRGDAAASAADARRAFEIASASADPQALAAAHTGLAMIAALEGDRSANDAHYLRALDYAEQAGDVLSSRATWSPTSTSTDSSSGAAAWCGSSTSSIGARRRGRR